MNRNYAPRKYTGYTCVLLFITAAFLFIRCTSTSQIAGTGSQTGNGRITCAIYNSEGSPASNAAVYLRSHDYTTDTLGAALGKTVISGYDTHTNADGTFSIDSVHAGTYCIEVNDGKSHAVLLTCSVSESDTLVHLPNDTLHPTGSIKGVFASAPNDSLALYVQIYGLERLGIRDTVTGGFIINDVPSGNYTVRVLTSSVDYQPVEVNNVIVDFNKTNDLGKIDCLPLSQWKYSTRLYLNTTSTGADVTGTVTDFPVLVRLQQSNFDFSQAKADGGDVRFSKSDGESLPYEIERWDAANKKAEIWVKVDTVYGNDSTQFITLYWGNSRAIGKSNSSGVFDTASGYQGVWHMDDDDGKTIHDVTADQYNGLKNGNQARVEGNIGFAQFFNGSGGGYIDMGNVCNLDAFNFTICAWIKKSGVNDIQTIVSKSAGGSAGSSYGWLFQLDKDGALSVFAATDSGSWGNTGTFVLTSNIWITDSAWHHVAAVIDRNKSNNCRVYIDGSDVSTLPTGGDIRNIGRVVNSSPLRFGSDANGGYRWNGSLDECSISYSVHSGSYIKLSFMNQKLDDALVIFKNN